MDISESESDLLLSVGGDDFGDFGLRRLLAALKETDVWRPVGFSHLLPKKASKLRSLGWRLDHTM